MERADFVLDLRGPRLFDTWRWIGSPGVAALPLLQLELQVPMGHKPSVGMLAVAEKLLEYARGNGEYLLDLIHAHYRYAEQEGWLSFWHVPFGISRAEVLAYVDSAALVVDAELVSSVFVDPKWEHEHKLDLLFVNEITRVNGRSFRLVGGILSLA